MLVGYARVSTGEQTLDLQLDALKEAGCKKIYSETISAVHPIKPELTKAMYFVHDGDVLAVYDMTRLGRNIRDIIEVSKVLEEKQVEIRFLKERIDTTTPAGKLYFHIMASIAQFERENLIQRTRAGLEAARQRGKAVGRPPALSDDQVDRAIYLLDREQATAADVADDLKVGYSTLCRYVAERRKAVSGRRMAQR